MHKHAYIILKKQTNMNKLNTTKSRKSKKKID